MTITFEQMRLFLRVHTTLSLSGCLENNKKESWVGAYKFNDRLGPLITIDEDVCLKYLDINIKPIQIDLERSTVTFLVCVCVSKTLQAV